MRLCLPRCYPIHQATPSCYASRGSRCPGAVSDEPRRYHRMRRCSRAAISTVLRNPVVTHTRCQSDVPSGAPQARSTPSLLEKADVTCGFAWHLPCSELTSVNILSRIGFHRVQHLTGRLSALRRSVHMRLLGSGSARVVLIPVLLVLVGCSLSTSSQSVSDSSASISASSESSSRFLTSSSRSSTSAERQTRYREEVRSYTAAYVRSGVQFDAFEKELGELARSHGLTHWEEDETTYVGIGEGLGDAAVGEAQLEMYKTSFSRSDPVKMQAIQRGYDTRQ